MKSVVPTKSGNTGLIPNKYYIASVSAALTNGLNKMNTYKEQWLEAASALYPTVMKLNSNNQVEASWEVPMPVYIGIALGMAWLDGPLPVMDLVATHLLYEWLS